MLLVPGVMTDNFKGSRFSASKNTEAEPELTETLAKLGQNAIFGLKHT